MHQQPARSCASYPQLNRTHSLTHPPTPHRCSSDTQVRISQLVGSHDNIVYMKEFVENKSNYYIVLEFLTGGELFDRIVEVLPIHYTTP